MLSCQRCQLTSHGPLAFFLTCRGCSRTWHHRCHIPPIEDEELFQRLRATNEKDTANGLETWMCRRCKKDSSKTPSVAPSREPTVSSDAHEDRKTFNSHHGPETVSNPAFRSVIDVRAQQGLNPVVDMRLVNGRQEAAPVKHTFIAKRTKSSAAHQPHVPSQPGPVRSGDTDVQITKVAPTKFTPREKRAPSPTSSYQDTGVGRSVSTASAMFSEEDIEMELPPMSIESTSRAISQASQTPPSDNQAIRPKPVADVPRAVSSTKEREQVRPAGGVAVQHQPYQDAANEMDDDPDDLYGPPVERRIIRILPSLAEELKEQQRRTAAEKEKRHAPLAPDWILARHAHDPLWKDIPTQGQRRRKAIARRLGDNGLNTNELMDNWVRFREYKT